VAVARRLEGSNPSPSALQGGFRGPMRVRAKHPMTLQTNGPTLVRREARAEIARIASAHRAGNVRVFGSAGAVNRARTISISSSRWPRTETCST
jgi:hypothetical protein